MKTVVVCAHTNRITGLDIFVAKDMSTAHDCLVRQLLSYLSYFRTPEDEGWVHEVCDAADKTRGSEDRTSVFGLWKQRNPEDHIEFFTREILES